MADLTLAVSIDTEEDDWGSFSRSGASSRNITRLPELQDVFDRWGAKPSYLVNLAPLQSSDSVAVLGALATRADVEIGGHCHPWNTPPFTGEGEANSMMYRFSVDENRGKLRTINERLDRELGVVPRTFRAGRWGYGPSVAEALVSEGYEIDCSVSPFIDWSDLGGPDFAAAPHRPYRCKPDAPFEARADGPLVELPTTVGFYRGSHRRAARLRSRLEKSVLAKFKVVGLLDRTGLLTRRWLSPETATAEEMIRLLDAWIESGETFAQLTFHSCTLLEGATPFVRDASDRTRFLGAIDTLLGHCDRMGCRFETLLEYGRGIAADPNPA